MIDYDKLMNTIREIIDDQTDDLPFTAKRDTDFGHGKRMGQILGWQECLEMIEELSMRDDLIESGDHD